MEVETIKEIHFVTFDGHKVEVRINQSFKCLIIQVAEQSQILSENKILLRASEPIKEISFDYSNPDI